MEVSGDETDFLAEDPSSDPITETVPTDDLVGNSTAGFSSGDMVTDDDSTSMHLDNEPPVAETAPPGPPPVVEVAPPGPPPVAEGTPFGPPPVAEVTLDGGLPQDTLEDQGSPEDSEEDSLEESPESSEQDFNEYSPADEGDSLADTAPEVLLQLSEFTAECCTVSDGEACTARDLYVAYLQW